MTRAFCSTSLVVVAGMVAALSSAGCSPLGPSSTGNNLPNAAISVENFSGTLKVEGVAFYSFTVVDGGTTYLSLLSLKQGGVDSDVLVTIGLGVPRGTACVATNVLGVTATGSLQLTGTTNPGVHCAVVFDSGNLTQDATFSLNIARPK